MAMENRPYNWGKKKTLDLRLQKLLPLHQNKKRKDTKRIERKKITGKNNLLHNIRKSVQPPTFYGGVNLKPKAILSLLEMVKILFKRGFREKKRKQFFFVERTSPSSVDSC